MKAACRCSWCTGGNRGQVGSRSAPGDSNAAPGGRRSAAGGSMASRRGIWARGPSGWCNGRRAPSHGRKNGSRGRRSRGCGRRTRGSTSLWSVGKAVGRRRERCHTGSTAPLWIAASFLVVFLGYSGEIHSPLLCYMWEILTPKWIMLCPFGITRQWSHSSGHFPSKILLMAFEDWNLQLVLSTDIVVSSLPPFPRILGINSMLDPRGTQSQTKNKKGKVWTQNQSAQIQCDFWCQVLDNSI